MGSFEISIKGDGELLGYLNDKVNLNKVRKIVKSNTTKLQRAAVNNAQFKKGYSKGTTRQSINSSIENSGLIGVIKTGTHYSGYVEVGTRKMEAQPFVKPALEVVEPEFIKELEEVMK